MTTNASESLVGLPLSSSSENEEEEEVVEEELSESIARSSNKIGILT